jgi:hypothetical protein
MKIIIFIIISFTFFSCETYRHSYNERRNLMLLKSIEQPSNRKFNSNKEINKKKRTYRKLRRR